MTRHRDRPGGPSPAYFTTDSWTSDPEAFIIDQPADAGVVTTVSLRSAGDVPFEKRRLIARYFGEMSRHLQWWSVTC